MKQLNINDFLVAITVSGWTLEDKTSLLAVLLDMTKEIIQRQLESKIADLQKIIEKTSTVECKIAQLKTEIVVLKYMTWENMGIQADQDFDWEEVALKLNKLHSASEYKAFWEKFFYPSVNIKKWSQKEHQALKCLVAEDMEDWESIARTLNTGRTAYQCFSYFQTNVSDAAHGQKWSQGEIEYLQEIINLYKKDNKIPWGKVAGLIKNRTKKQCHNKYSRMSEARKGRFIPEEDTVILSFVNAHGTDFRKMSSFLSGRSSKQLRVRYNLLLKERLSTTWSVEDDKKLLQVMTNPDMKAKRTSSSSVTCHFPGKNKNHIRSRLYTLRKWIEKHPHSDIEEAPRRGVRRLSHGESTSNLEKAVHACQAKINGLIHKSLNDKKLKKLPRKLRDTTKKRRKVKRSLQEKNNANTLREKSDWLADNSLEMLKFDKSRVLWTYSKNKVIAIKQNENAILPAEDSGGA